MANNDEYTFQPMISYLGNKRKLIGHIEKYIVRSKPKTALDGFCGSGVVSRMMKGHVKRLYVNDLEPYSIAIQRGYLPNITSSDRNKIEKFIEELNIQVDELVKANKKPRISIISRYYSPKDSNNITEGERCFYSSENGLRIDHYIGLLGISRGPSRFIDAAIANLLVKCSIHTNTSGVFKAFYKVDGVGHWGGYKEHDLQRILRPIRLECPIFSKGGDIEYNIGTIDSFWEGYSDTLEPIDFAYYDPPYNQHPYGSNYFMLNIIYRAISEPEYVSGLSIDPNSISGIPKDWTRSDFNYEKSALGAVRDMIDNSNSKDIVLSYNDGGLVSKEDILEILGSRGSVEVEEICYKNLNSRPNKKMGDKVNEYLFYSKME